MEGIDQSSSRKTRKRDELEKGETNEKKASSLVQQSAVFSECARKDL